jgi:hypothetical protein
MLDDLRDLCADLENHLLDLAYDRDAVNACGADAGGETDHPFAIVSRSPRSRLRCALQCIDLLMVGPHIRALRAAGMSVEFVIMAELLRIERACIGPEHGMLRVRDVHCAIWNDVYEHLRLRVRTPLWQLAAPHLERHGAEVPPVVQRLWLDAYDALLDAAAERPAQLLRLAADQGGHSDRYRSDRQPVRGASRYGIEVTADATLGGQIFVLARRVWLGVSGSPAMDIPHVRIQLATSSTTHTWLELASHTDSAVWYENLPLGPAPTVSAWALGAE